MTDMVDEFEAIEEKYKLTFKKEQKEAISAILNGDDVFAVLPTGFGKSYIYTFLRSFPVLKEICQGPFL